MRGSLSAGGVRKRADGALRLWNLRSHLSIRAIETHKRFVDAQVNVATAFADGQAVGATQTSGPRRRVLALLHVARAASLVACTESTLGLRFKFTDITGSIIGGNVTMPDFTGKPRTLSEIRSGGGVLFFRFMQCPDGCPTTLSEAAAALRELGPKADEVQILFITVDPARDTPELLAQYVTAFRSKFLGLHGSDKELEQVAEIVKLYYAENPSSGGGYSIDHTAGQFLLDKQERPRLLVQHSAGPTVLAHDLNPLLR